MFLAGVVAFGSETPALGDAGSRPYLVDVVRERFGEGCQRGGQFDAADVDRLRNIRLFHVRLFSVAFLRALLPVGAAAVGKADLRNGGNACCPNKNSDFFEPHDLFLPKVGTPVGILNGKGEIHPLTITNILGVMLIYDFTRLEPGGLYLFFPAAAPSGGLWGIFERHDRAGRSAAGRLFERSPRLRTVVAAALGIYFVPSSLAGGAGSLYAGAESAVLLRLNGAQGPAVRFPL